MGKRSKDFTAPNISKLEAERNQLLVSKSNPERLKEIEKILNWFFWGIK